MCRKPSDDTSAAAVESLVSYLTQLGGAASLISGWRARVVVGGLKAKHGVQQSSQRTDTYWYNESNKVFRSMISIAEHFQLAPVQGGVSKRKADSQVAPHAKKVAVAGAEVVDDAKKRPIGRPPAGKMWDTDKGAYVDKPTSDAEVVKVATEKKRPSGRPPVGKVWDPIEGVYLEEGRRKQAAQCKGRGGRDKCAHFFDDGQVKPKPKPPHVWALATAVEPVRPVTIRGDAPRRQMIVKLQKARTADAKRRELHRRDDARRELIARREYHKEMARSSQTAKPAHAEEQQAVRVDQRKRVLRAMGENLLEGDREEEESLVAGNVAPGTPGPKAMEETEARNMANAMVAEAAEAVLEAAGANGQVGGGGEESEVESDWSNDDEVLLEVAEYVGVAVEVQEWRCEEGEEEDGVEEEEDDDDEGEEDDDDEGEEGEATAAVEALAEDEDEAVEAVEAVGAAVEAAEVVAAARQRWQRRRLRVRN